jgi:hypothetical protein
MGSITRADSSMMVVGFVLVLLGVGQGQGPVVFAVAFLIALPCTVIQIRLALGQIDDVGRPFLDSDYPKAARIAASAVGLLIVIFTLVAFVATVV